MKRYLMMLPMLLSPFIFCSCPPSGEYHTVRVYEYGKKVTPKVTTKSDDPRDFKPTERF